MICHGRKGVVYEVGPRLKGSKKGAEGFVHEMVGMPGCVAKIYKKKRFETIPNVEDGRDYLRRKIECMLDLQVETYFTAMDAPGRSSRSADRRDASVLTVAWPLDTLTNEQGEFVGFVMPNAKKSENLLVAYAESERERYFPGYNFHTALAIARNLALAVTYLHDQDVVIGDFNTNNAMVAQDCSVTLVDADSYSVADPATGELYKCMGAVGEVLAPELQGRDLSLPSSVFTKESDCFSLAIHIFTVLTGFHPFGCAGLEFSRDSASDDPVVISIARGACPYVTGSNLPKPQGAPDPRLLPPSLRTLFDRAFGYNARTAMLPETIARRPNAKEWLRALDAILFGGRLVACAQDVSHVYVGGNPAWPSARLGPCPWCEQQRRIKGVPPLPHPTPPEPPPAPPEPIPEPEPQPSPWPRRILFALLVGLILGAMWYMVSHGDIPVVPAQTAASIDGWLDECCTPTFYGLTNASTADLVYAMEDRGWSWMDDVQGFNYRGRGGFWVLRSSQGEPYGLDEIRGLHNSSVAYPAIFEIGASRVDYYSLVDLADSLDDRMSLAEVKWVNDTQTQGLMVLSDTNPGWLVYLAESDSSQGDGCDYYVWVFNGAAIQQGWFDEVILMGEHYGDTAEEIFEAIQGA